MWKSLSHSSFSLQGDIRVLRRGAVWDKRWFSIMTIRIGIPNDCDKKIP